MMTVQTSFPVFLTFIFGIKGAVLCNELINHNIIRAPFKKGLFFYINHNRGGNAN
jgi:uncharacterized membrane protein YsdA (DUF1294 family)